MNKIEHILTKNKSVLPAKYVEADETILCICTRVYDPETKTLQCWRVLGEYERTVKTELNAKTGEVTELTIPKIIVEPPGNIERVHIEIDKVCFEISDKEYYIIRNMHNQLIKCAVYKYLAY